MHVGHNRLHLWRIVCTSLCCHWCISFGQTAGCFLAPGGENTQNKNTPQKFGLLIIFVFVFATSTPHGWAYLFLWWANPLPPLFFYRSDSSSDPTPMIGDVCGGEKPGMTNKGWTLEWQGSASRGSVCSVDPGGHCPSARGVVSYWWHCCWFQCEGGRRSPTTIPLVK